MTIKNNDSELLMLVMRNDKMFQVLEHLYIIGRVTGDIARTECDTNTLNIMYSNKLVHRRFLKRGTYVSSMYGISKTGKYIYELAVTLKRSDI